MFAKHFSRPVTQLDTEIDDERKERLLNLPSSSSWSALTVIDL